MDTALNVNEIFASIDGEGVRTGQLATFIRLCGCNLRCVYCDTAYAFDNASGTQMTISEIIQKVQEIGFHNITLTGGEPLIHEGAWQLAVELAQKGFQVNIETNGSLDLCRKIAERDKKNLDIFFTVDYKCLSSGMNFKMNVHSFDFLAAGKDIIKCVVGNEDDMTEALQYLDNVAPKIRKWFSPVFGEIEPAEIVEYVKKHKREDVTIQVQLHKIIWDPKRRGV